MDMQFILGSPDPEMQRIEEILRSAGYSVRHAIYKGRRVPTKFAYEGERASGAVKWDGAVAWVECEIPAKKADHHVVVDHHRPGDFGYGVGPDRFFEASSIGQICHLISYEPTDDILYAAAADHCLRDAYAGLCPNIDPERLRAWRSETRAVQQRIDISTFDQNLNTTIERLLRRPKITVGGHEFYDAMDCEYRELSDASAILGVGVMHAYYERRINRHKVTVINGTPQAMEAWMSWAKSQPYLEDIYGDPVRGFAGGYVRRGISSATG